MTFVGQQPGTSTPPPLTTDPDGLPVAASGADPAATQSPDVEVRNADTFNTEANALLQSFLQEFGVLAPPPGTPVSSTNALAQLMQELRDAINQAIETMGKAVASQVENIYQIAMDGVKEMIGHARTAMIKGMVAAGFSAVVSAASVGSSVKIMRQGGDSRLTQGKLQINSEVFRVIGAPSDMLKANAGVDTAEQQGATKRADAKESVERAVQEAKNSVSKALNQFLQSIAQLERGNADIQRRTFV